MRISDWSSDVCSSDLQVIWQVAARRITYKKLDKRSALYKAKRKIEKAKAPSTRQGRAPVPRDQEAVRLYKGALPRAGEEHRSVGHAVRAVESAEGAPTVTDQRGRRSDEHTSDLQPLMRISYAVFCWKKHRTHERK